MQEAVKDETFRPFTKTMQSRDPSRIGRSLHGTTPVCVCIFQLTGWGLCQMDVLTDLMKRWMKPRSSSLTASPSVHVEVMRL